MISASTGLGLMWIVEVGPVILEDFFYLLETISLFLLSSVILRKIK